jgi:Ca2+-transporting ATPase
LPAIVTIALAVGLQRMAEQQVLVRRLAAVETLGSATVICTDKTGTLTTGLMTVREIWGWDQKAILYAAAACSDADRSSQTGDTMELAILDAAWLHGIDRDEIEGRTPRSNVLPFDSVRKRMSVLRSDGVLYVKGAPELLLPLCQEGTTGAELANRELAERGLRVLAVAKGSGEKEENLTLLGLVGLADPPRPEAIAAVAQAREAGIKTVMITGDQLATATAIARELGILKPDERAEDCIHARVSPEDKLHIVRSWKDKGEVVAMTGDGVNDAPALKEAHIGVAMGKSGTEVTREAADMVLSDDNFASIVAAIREGRGIFDNIQKTLIYLLGGNSGELVVMAGAALLGMPLPLLPLQILWVNLVTDGLPALALVVEPVDPGVLSRKPRKPDAPMLGIKEWSFIAGTGLLQGLVTLGIFIYMLQTEGLQSARNMAFSTMVFGELFRAFGARSTTLVLFELGIWSNMRLLGIVVFSALFQLALHHVPVMQELFELSPLSGAECLVSVGLGLVPITVIEVGKLVRRWI